MFEIITTSRGSPAARSRPDAERAIPFPRMDTTGPEDREGPAAGSPRVRPTAGDPWPGLRIFEPKSRGSRKTDLGRARRLLAADLSHIPHPSFLDPDAHAAILAPAAGFEGPGPEPTPADRHPGAAPAPRERFPSREREAHAFRKLNCLKFLAARLRDRLDPEDPDPAELDAAERLRAAALRLRNRIVETHVPLVVSVAKKYFRAGSDLPDRVSDGAFALMQAVERFDFARGHRFSTYASWAVINELARSARRRRRHNRAVALHDECLPAREPDSERYEREEAGDVRRAAVERLLGRLDGRERRILEARHGLGGGPERSLQEIGRELGISKERVRQIEQRAHAKLRSLARLEAIEPSSL